MYNLVLLIFLLCCLFHNCLVFLAKQLRKIGGGGFGVREYSKFATIGATTIIFTDAINATLLYASRGGIDVGAILTSGTPTGNQVVWDNTTGTLTVAADVPFLDDEFVRILVK